LAFGASLLLALGALAPGAARAGRDEGPGPLPWRVGGEYGFSVDAAAFPDSAGSLLEVYVRIRPTTLEALGQDRLEPGRFRLALRLRNAYGAKEHETEHEFTVSRGDTARGLGKVILFPIRTRPGTHRLMVRMVTPRRSRAGSLPGKPHTESVEGELVVPGPRAERDLSDIEFVWSEGHAAEGPVFRRAGHTVLPNPERLYGLYADTLRAMLVARPRPGDTREWRWVARMLDEQGRALEAREGTSPGGLWTHIPVVMDVSSRPAGGYDLELKAWQEGDPEALSRRATFSIAWQVGSWTRDPQDVLDDAHFLLEPESEEAFARMQPGRQERVMDEFWRRRDPTPETAENEARQKFLERVDFANRTFGRYGLGKGMFSDMGRVFIRYGEPSEVLKQVIPSRDNTLAEVVRDLVAVDRRVVGNVSDKQLGADMRPFEVWTYEGEIPLPPETEPGANRASRTRKRLVFLFVDEQWLGDFRLRYSTE